MMFFCQVTPAPATKLKLEWVYGYRGRDARANLHLLPTGISNIETHLIQQIIKSQTSIITKSFIRNKYDLKQYNHKHYRRNGLFCGCCCCSLQCGGSKSETLFGTYSGYQVFTQFSINLISWMLTIHPHPHHWSSQSCLLVSK